MHGIGGGFTGVGAKTVIPAKAVAKVSIRLVPKQDPDKIVKSVEKFVNDNAPRGVQFDVRVLSAGPGLMVNTDHHAIQVAAKAFSDIYGKPTVFTRSGGSIPIVGDFATHLGIPTILMGFGLPDDGLHSPNEKYNIRNYYDGIGLSHISSKNTEKEARNDLSLLWYVESRRRKFLFQVRKPAGGRTAAIATTAIGSLRSRRR